MASRRNANETVKLDNCADSCRAPATGPKASLSSNAALRAVVATTKLE
jgi:hypothetical protein